MNGKLNELIDRIRELEARREALHLRIEGRRVQFEQEILARHNLLKTGLLKYLGQASLRNLATAPIIYSLILPLLLLDLAVTLYQFICFPLYRLPQVRRGDFMVHDRSQLAYLNLVEKLNCEYCAYANGLAADFRRVAAVTKQYWCPIKHARRILDTHAKYGRFADFGDGEGYRRERVRLHNGQTPP